MKSDGNGDWNSGGFDSLPSFLSGVLKAPDTLPAGSPRRPGQRRDGGGVRGCTSRHGPGGSGFSGKQRTQDRVTDCAGNLKVMITLGNGEQEGATGIGTQRQQQGGLRWTPRQSRSITTILV